MQGPSFYLFLLRGPLKFKIISIDPKVLLHTAGGPLTPKITLHLESQTVTREKLHEELLYENFDEIDTRIAVNFTIILRATFAPIFFQPKITKANYN